jgi:hypothetical protein
VILDCLELYRHFRQSYEEHARDAITGMEKGAQERLDRLTASYEKQAAGLVAKLPPSFPRWPSEPTTMVTPTSGVASFEGTAHWRTDGLS